MANRKDTLRINVWFISLLIRKRPWRFIILWFSMLWLFVYLTSLDLFGVIFTNPNLNFFEKISFMINSFTTIISNVTDPRVLSIFLFSFVTAINLMLMGLAIKRKQQAKGVKASTFGSVGALVGSHCIACGGSFLAPFVTTIAGSGAYFSASRINTAIYISVVINVIAIIFIGKLTLKLADQEKNFLLSSPD